MKEEPTVQAAARAVPSARSEDPAPLAAAGDIDRAAPWLAECMHRIAAGDADALARMMRVVTPRLLRLAQGITRNEADAEEAVNDTWRQVWRHAAAFDQRRAPVFGWLVAIAQRQAIDIVRRRDARARYEVGDEHAAEQLPMAAADPTRDIEAQQGLSIVRKVLLHLTTRRRTVARLALLEQHSHSEIARQTGTPLGTVKTRVRDALRALRAGFGR